MGKWETNYEYVKKYYEEKGHLLIPKSYKIDDINLGNWINNQRVAYKNNQLSKERKKLLEEIEMVWNLHEYNWEEIYEYAKKYYEKKGHLLIPRSYKKDDIYLGEWINSQRTAYKANKLSEERKNLLEEIGMIWNVHKYKFLYGEIDNDNKRYIKIKLLKYVENILKKQDQQSLFESKQDINEINDKLILELI